MSSLSTNTCAALPFDALSESEIADIVLTRQNKWLSALEEHMLELEWEEEHQNRPDPNWGDNESEGEEEYQRIRPARRPRA